MLAIRGSLEMGDFISDMSAEGVDVCLMGRHGHVHEGMLSAATYVVLRLVGLAGGLQCIYGVRMNGHHE